jgi:hypothetical protein
VIGNKDPMASAKTQAAHAPGAIGDGRVGKWRSIKRLTFRTSF